MHKVIEMRGRNKIRVMRRKSVDDVGVIERRKRDHTFNEDGMSFTAMTTNDSGDNDF